MKWLAELLLAAALALLAAFWLAPQPDRPLPALPGPGDPASAPAAAPAMRLESAEPAPVGRIASAPAAAPPPAAAAGPAGPESAPAAPARGAAAQTPPEEASRGIAALFGWQPPPPPAPARGPAPPPGPAPAEPAAADWLKPFGFVVGQDGGRTYVFKDSRSGNVLSLSPGGESKGWRLLEASTDGFILEYNGQRYRVK